ncbi:hypothetical protein [Sphingomonas pseudosanguinis]|uniref:Hemerythrin-like domain-containing protein n=1 Tax=Sphingomonas pseudosanguinis TaxID=413712 RepID=A0A7W6F3W6_9SPHN|nr:hypothetical protein [Sphingomonas pseudosanguinis]MBB3880469.1 hypothetical protein [Sphingomonas pseudosanguinis]MBN3537306.1 hypothetical protein [Sphingomonas pseudosanguinis]
MLSELQAFHGDILKAMREHHALCQSVTPDRTALSAVRWQMAQAGRVRMQFLNDVVFPIAEQHADSPGGAAMLALRAAIPAYRQKISAFVSVWSADAIAADWNGYRAAALGLRPTILQFLRDEETHLRALMADLGSPVPANLLPLSYATGTTA